MMQLTQENYTRGFLVDDELMAGVTQHPENPELYIAFILQHTTGEYLGYQPFAQLDEALRSINHVPRTWTFENLSGCGGCGEGGGCGGGGCGKGACQNGVCPV
jgi:hypothetical protein